MIIALSSLPGSGVEDISKLLALQLGIKYLPKETILKKMAKKHRKSVQEIESLLTSEKFIEELRELINKEAKSTHVIIDWPLACWVASDSMKVFLYMTQKSRANVITKKAKIPLSDAKEKLRKEDDELKQNILSLLGINIYDVKNFDLAMNMDKIGIEGAASVIMRYLKNIKTR
ncbi:MAG: cytidylate kinase family protein [Candidatus Diapherotrites archaeon]|nr:cytidylate kinase family protein [Candidatus Diapherotrites archaeon]